MLELARARVRQVAALLSSSLLLVVCMLAAASQAHAAVRKCTTLCLGKSGACSVKPGVATVPPGSVVDCSGRDVILEGFTSLKVEDGSFKLIAASLLVRSTAAIKAIEVDGAGALGIEIETTGTVIIYGSLQADGKAGGGRIAVDAGGNIVVADDGSNGVEASGTGPGADGGDIALNTEGTLIVQNPVRARSAEWGDVVGGHVSLNAARDVLISKPSTRVSVNGSKMDAGTVEITAGRDVRVFDSARLEADSRYVGGKGGTIALTAANRVELSSDVSARGSTETHGESSNGGTLSIESGCGGVAVAADVDLRGGEFGGGSLDVETMGDVTIAAGAVLDVHGSGFGGGGGDVRLDAGKKITLGTGALIDARADATDPNGNGRAGSVALLGCEVDTAADAKILARGRRGGDITLNAASENGPQGTTLHVSGTSVLDNRSTVSAKAHGAIRVAIVAEALTGKCTTDPARTCAVDAPDCTVGLTRGECRGLNPDTDGTLAQFLVRPQIFQDSNMTGCSSECR